VENDPPVRFIVASYGAKHVGMLLTHLHSIAQSHPNARAAVYWQDIPLSLLAALRTAFPRYDFHETSFDFSNDFLLRISSKVHSWCRAAEEYAGEADLCWADVDTLVLRDVAPFLAKDGADVIFTDKPDRTALNTGVILAHGNVATVAFFRAWRDRTLAICRDPELYAQANDYSLGYGAADQMALWQMLNYERGRTDYTIEAEGEYVHLRAEPCALLNETNSVPVTAEKHILHYKSGWQPILLQGRPFTRNRPRETSWPMFTLYLREFRSALAHLNAPNSSDFSAHDFGVVIPSYLEVESGAFDSTRYAVHRAGEAAKAAMRTLGYAARKLTGGTPSHS
jgi:hypothetical protein